VVGGGTRGFRHEDEDVERREREGGCEYLWVGGGMVHCEG